MSIFSGQLEPASPFESFAVTEVAICIDGFDDTFMPWHRYQMENFIEVGDGSEQKQLGLVSVQLQTLRRAPAADIGNNR